VVSPNSAAVFRIPIRAVTIPSFPHVVVLLVVVDDVPPLVPMRREMIHLPP